MKKLIPSLLSGALLLALTTGSAMAGSAATAFTAGVTVDQACEVSGTPMAFGSMGMLADAAHAISGADNIQAQSTVTLNCTGTMPITVSIHGNGASGKYTMKTPSNYALHYRIYQDAAYTTLWGNVADNAALAMNATVGTQTVTAYGEILGSDNSSGSGSVALPVVPGSYSDTVTVTAAW